MSVTDLDHGVEDVVPGAWCLEHGVREHTAIPADVLDAAGCGVFEPVTGGLGYVELAVRIVSAAMLASLVVAACTVDGSVVLGDVEVDGPGAESIGHLFIGGPEFSVAVAFFEKGVLRSIVAEGVKIGVGKVSLEAEGVWHADAFEDIEHVLPGVHPGPADFAFSGEALAMISGDLCGFLEGIHDAGGAGRGIFAPFGHAELGGVDADDAVFTDTMVIEDLGDAAGHLHGAEEFFLLGIIAHGGVTDGAGPDGSDEGADAETFAGDEVGDFVELVVAGLRIGVREEEEVVDAFELLAVDIGCGSEVEHALQADRWLLAFAVAFTDEAGPHRVMKFGCRIAHGSRCVLRVGIRLFWVESGGMIDTAS